MVVFVAANPIFPAKKRFIETLRSRHPEITTILLNINPMRTSMVLGESERVLFGPGFIEDTLCGCIFRISAKSFYQINPVQTELLYGQAIAFAGLTGRETVIDAYCGIGTIGLIASRKAGQVCSGQTLHPALGCCKQPLMDGRSTPLPSPPKKTVPPRNGTDSIIAKKPPHFPPCADLVLFCAYFARKAPRPPDPPIEKSAPHRRFILLHLTNILL